MGPAALGAQGPAVAPTFARAWSRDTTFTVWLFVQPRTPLAAAAQRLTLAGAHLRVRSRWLHALSAAASTPVLRTLAADPTLVRIQPLGRWRKAPGSDPTLPRLLLGPDTCAAAGDPTYGPSEMPYRQLDLRPLADRGVDGTGVRIAILDAGFNTLDPVFAGVTVTAQYDFVFGDSVVRNQPNDSLILDPQFHGTAVWSLFAGLVPGRLRGIARGASYLLAKTEDIRSETRIEEDNYVAALEWADSIGVDIASSSLGYLTFDNGFSYLPSQLNGDIAVTTVAAESASAHGILVVTAAGNSGPGFRTLVTPGDGKSVITVGAEDSLGVIAAFSSRGPTADGRLKPDVTAPGVQVCAEDGSTLGRLSGTSFATPLTAAGAALVKELHPELGPAGVRAALRAWATNRASPDSTRGWGRPDFTSAAIFPVGVTPLAPLPPVLTTVSPTFSWTVGSTPGFAGPVSYRLRVGRDSLLARPAVDTVLSATQFTAAAAFKPGTPLYWRVDATAMGTATAATTGVVGPIRVPAWASLTTLSDSAGAATDSAQPTFTWSSPAIASPPGPFRYDLEVFRVDQPFPVYGAAGLIGTSFSLPIVLERNAAYRWTLIVHAGPDTSLISSAGIFLVLDASTPQATLLYQNFPNPFPAAGHDSTCIWFDIAIAAQTELAVLDLRGGVVRRLIPGAELSGVVPPGRYGRGSAGGSTCDPQLTWDGRTDDGRMAPSGVYILSLRSGTTVLFKHIVFLGKTH